MVTLGEVVTIDRNSVTPENIASGTRYVGLENMDSDGEIHGIQIVDNGELRSNKFQFDSQHILYGKLRPYLRKICRPDFSGICSTDILPIRCGPEMDRNFVYHYLRKQEMVDMATSRCSGANLPRISPKILLTFQIPKPPLEEQKRIATILDKADAINSSTFNIQQLRQQLITSLFYEKFGDVALNDKQWNIVKLSDIAEYFIGLTYKPENVSDYGTVVLRSSNVQDGIIVLDDIVRVDKMIKQKLFVKENDILMCTRNGSARLVGKVAKISGLEERMTFGAFMTIIRSDYHDYLLTYFRTEAFRRQIVSGATTTVNQITKYMLERISLPLPPMELIQEFASLVNKVDNMLDIQNLANISSLSLSQELLT